jgi:hypothetical protein
MPDLFDEIGGFTNHGMEILREISSVINPIFLKYKEKGFKSRDIGHAASFAVHDCENIICLKDMSKRMKEKLITKQENKNESNS